VICNRAEHGTVAQAGSYTVNSSSSAVAVTYKLWSVSGAWSQHVMTTTISMICCPVSPDPRKLTVDGSHLTAQDVLQGDLGLISRSSTATMTLASATACLAV
jgi:hypothetical protein